MQGPKLYYSSTDPILMGLKNCFSLCFKGEKKHTVGWIVSEYDWNLKVQKREGGIQI